MTEWIRFHVCVENATHKGNRRGEREDKRTGQGLFFFCLKREKKGLRYFVGPTRVAENPMPLARPFRSTILRDALKVYGNSII